MLENTQYIWFPLCIPHFSLSSPDFLLPLYSFFLFSGSPLSLFLHLPPLSFSSFFFSLTLTSSHGFFLSFLFFLSLLSFISLPLSRSPSFLHSFFYLFFFCSAPQEFSPLFFVCFFSGSSLHWFSLLSSDPPLLFLSFFPFFFFFLFLLLSLTASFGSPSFYLYPFSSFFSQKNTPHKKSHPLLF